MTTVAYHFKHDGYVRQTRLRLSGRADYPSVQRLLARKLGRPAGDIYVVGIR